MTLPQFQYDLQMKSTFNFHPLHIRHLIFDMKCQMSNRTVQRLPITGYLLNSIYVGGKDFLNPYEVSCRNTSDFQDLRIRQEMPSSASIGITQN